MRTAKAEFRPQFLVRPQVITDNEAEKVLNIIRAGFLPTESLKGDSYREMVIPYGDYYIHGAAIPMEALYRRCGETPMYYETADAQNGRARRIVAFIGFMFKRNASGGMHIRFEDFLEIVKKHVPARWDEDQMTTANWTQATLVPFSNQDFQKCSADSIPGILYNNIGGNHPPFAVNHSERDSRNIAEWVSCEVLKGRKISFCSNINEERCVERYKFSIVTCSDSNIVSQINAKSSEASLVIPREELETPIIPEVWNKTEADHSYKNGLFKESRALDKPTAANINKESRKQDYLVDYPTGSNVKAEKNKCDLCGHCPLEWFHNCVIKPILTLLGIEKINIDSETSTETETAVRIPYPSETTKRHTVSGNQESSIQETGRPAHQVSIKDTAVSRPTTKPSDDYEHPQKTILNAPGPTWYNELTSFTGFDNMGARHSDTVDNADEQAGRYD